MEPPSLAGSSENVKPVELNGAQPVPEEASMAPTKSQAPLGINAPTVAALECPFNNSTQKSYHLSNNLTQRSPFYV